jgi:transcriptional regulator with XRE-family HTH domain
VSDPRLIRWAREDEGLSQGQLAERIGMTCQQLSRIESPDSNLTIATLDASRPGSAASSTFDWQSIDYMDDRKIAELGGTTARSGVWSTPTLALFNIAFAIRQTEAEARARPDWPLIPREVRDLYVRGNARYWTDSTRAIRTDVRRQRYVAVRSSLVKAIHDSRGRILAGSDAPEWLLGYGWTLHRELEALVSAGLTPYEALVTATHNPAEFLGMTREWSPIERGKRADLVLLDANPLAQIRNTNRIKGVSIRGRWYPRAKLDSMVSIAVTKVGAGPR